MGLSGLLDQKRPGEAADSLVEAFKPVRARVGDLALDALRHFREDLPKKCFDHDDYQLDREQLLQIGALAGKFSSAVEAHEMLHFPVPESFEERLGVLTRLVDTDRVLPGKESDSLFSSGPSAFEQAMADYRLLLHHRLPGQTLDEAAETLTQVHRVLVEAMGWEASRESFAFLQRGLAKEGFGERTSTEVMQDYLAAALSSDDLQYARTVARTGQAPSGEIRREGDRVVINGIPLRRRA